ncbi:MAG TPA: amidohydrolase family protein [Vicinamibacteria bacterium]|nr:amidohydrolase family protein [Vicinamibacteria bacterium]
MNLSLFVLFAIEIVLRGGRVMDPETGLDAVRNVGIEGGTIVAVSEEPLEGTLVVDASGLVVSPGFIDLHAHGQDPVSNRLQALDGVTTALEMEIGVYPVAAWLASREGKAVIHYGATVGHLPARAKLFHGIDVGSWALGDESDANRQRLMKLSDYAYKATSDAEMRELEALMVRGVEEGGLGFGLGITYTPGATREEILRLFEVARDERVPIYVHLRGEGSGGTLGAFQEVIANAAATGASLHIVHMNSSAGDLGKTTLSMIRGARAAGIDVTTEAYPYTAGSTRLESALFDSWVDGPDESFQNLQWPLTGERLTRESFQRFREEGGWVIIHGGRSEEVNEWITAQPDVMVASDGIPFFNGPAHPRGAGTFARVLGRYARDKKGLPLMDALGKMTLMPAERLSGAAPQMGKKGRIQVGADADITVFDADRILDLSTYEKGDIPSRGIAHVLVGGTFVVRDSKPVDGVFPGKAIRSARPE